MGKRPGQGRGQGRSSFEPVRGQLGKQVGMGCVPGSQSDSSQEVTALKSKL